MGDRDYLLGVSDVSRQGALRFKTHDDGPYEHPDDAVPKHVALPSLLRAAESVVNDDGLDAVKLLLDAGTGSLGGARPKASVRDGDRLQIAKFAHPGDEWQVIAPVNRLVRIEGQPVLLLDRFDRRGDSRVGYMSAMTLLEADDGETHDYLDLADVMTEHSGGRASG